MALLLIVVPEETTMKDVIGGAWNCAAMIRSRLSAYAFGRVTCGSFDFRIAWTMNGVLS